MQAVSVSCKYEDRSCTAGAVQMACATQIQANVMAAKTPIVWSNTQQQERSPGLVTFWSLHSWHYSAISGSLGGPQ